MVQELLSYTFLSCKEIISHPDWIKHFLENLEIINDGLVLRKSSEKSDAFSCRKSRTCDLFLPPFPRNGKYSSDYFLYTAKMNKVIKL